VGERQNKIVCAFDLKSPRISSYDIHEWIYAQMRLDENEVTMVQIDGPKRHLYINFRDNNRLQDVLHLTGGQVEHRHTNGEISIVRLETAGLGMRRVRIIIIIIIIIFINCKWVDTRCKPPPRSVGCCDTNGAVQI
jgi:hypothetical protein